MFECGFEMVSQLFSIDTNKEIKTRLGEPVVLKKPAWAVPMFRSAIQDVFGHLWCHRLGDGRLGVLVPAGAQVTVTREGRSDPGWTSIEGEGEYPTREELQALVARWEVKAASRKAASKAASEAAADRLRARVVAEFRSFAKLRAGLNAAHIPFTFVEGQSWTRGHLEAAGVIIYHLGGSRYQVGGQQRDPVLGSRSVVALVAALHQGMPWRKAWEMVTDRRLVPITKHLTEFPISQVKYLSDWEREGRYGFVIVGRDQWDERWVRLRPMADGGYDVGLWTRQFDDGRPTGFKTKNPKEVVTKVIEFLKG